MPFFGDKERKEQIMVERVLMADGTLKMPYEPENLDIVRAMPKARWNPTNKTWSVSLEMGDRLRVLELADRIGLQVDPSLRNVEISEQAEMASTFGLYNYQIDGVNFLAHKNKALLADEMGLGKTVQALMSIPKNSSAMVICRAGLKYNWQDEILKWREDMEPIVVGGRNNFQWAEKNQIVIINNDILPQDFMTPKRAPREAVYTYYERLKAWRNALKSKNPQAENTILILDEAHDYKNYQAARSVKIKELCGMCKKVIGLTGSPLDNRPQDLYGVLDSLHLAKETFGDFDKFKTLFNCSYDTIHTRNGCVYKPIWGKPKPIVPELLRRVMMRRKRSEVLPDLPQKTYTNIVIGDIDKSLQKKLDALWTEWQDTLEIGELPPFSEFSEIRAALAKHRTKAMLEIVEDAEEQEVPLVVFSAHLAPLDELLGREGWAVITGAASPEKRQEIVRSFQAGLLKGVGVSIKAGGVGINLTHSWKALFVDLDWTPASNWQAEDRLARIGQKSNKVEIARMVSNHPLDLHIHNMLVDKIDTIVSAIDKMIVGNKIECSNENETEEEFHARMDQIRSQVETQDDKKLIAKSKVGKIFEREKAKLKKEPLELTDERIAAVRESFKYMLSVCDGALNLDGIGFNKPDAIVAHCLLTAGLETHEEISAAQFILNRYHRQLSKNFPILFKE